MTAALIDLFCRSVPTPPAAIAVDIDDTCDAVHRHRLRPTLSDCSNNQKSRRRYYRNVLGRGHFKRVPIPVTRQFDAPISAVSSSLPSSSSRHLSFVPAIETHSETAPS